MQSIPPRHCWQYTAILICASTLPRSAAAIELDFTIDPSESIVSVSGEVTAAGVDAMPQGPGADSTSYSGSVLVEIDDPLAATSITFLGGAVVAANSGSWLPEAGGGSVGSIFGGDASPGTVAPAVYGLEASAGVIGSTWIAIRDLQLSTTSDPLPITDGKFATTQDIVVTQGNSDFTVSSIVFGDLAERRSLVGDPLPNISEDEGEIDVVDGVITLSLPVVMFFEVEDPNTGIVALELTYTGTIVARAEVDMGLDGDFDKDGDVDGDDFLAWQTGFGTTGGASQGDGDADGDGDVDGDDFLIWQSNFGAGTGGAGVAVCEPATSSLLAVAWLTLGPRRGGRRRSRNGAF